MLGFLAFFAIQAILAVQYAEARTIRGRQWHDFVLEYDSPTDLSRHVADQHFIQQLDHFDASNNKTWLQRFWYNDQWYKPGGPQFLMIGGEGPGSSKWVERDQTWILLAKEVGAAVFLLEHRFYGESQPTGDLKFESLKYLTSEQALADINSFILAQNKVFNFTNPRWITFGGSYGGSLSAWARQKYPDAVYAAVASSGPVQAVVDFTGFLDVVYNAIHSYNPKCVESVHKGFLKINSLVADSQGRETISKLFNTCHDLKNADNNSIYKFYDSIIGEYMDLVQNGGNNKNIPELCERQLGAESDFDGVVAVIHWSSSDCVEDDYQTEIDNFKNAVVGSQQGNFRSWQWQTCNEFGYYQSTDSDLNVHKFTGADIPVDYYVQQCADIFDASLDNATVYANVEKTNSHYFGQTGYNGTRVVFPNGSNDPWHVLSVLKATNEEVYPILINGTSHCADMHAPYDADPPSLVAAREEIRKHVLNWVDA